MLRKSIVAIAIFATFSLGSAYADSLVIDGINEGKGSAPAKGLTQVSVASKWGEPINKKAPVGEPPISSWEYEPFVVYFEYDRVIHSVAKR